MMRHPVQPRIFERTMKYKNSEMSIDSLVAYFSDSKISLIPPFQRGGVWSLAQRRKLIENIVTGKPIPAIFLYKEAAGSRVSYNILDGKQRLESLLLFIGSSHTEMRIPNWRDYFFQKREGENFTINVAPSGDRKKMRPFAELDDSLVRKLREYAIPTIEIDLDDEEGSLDEVISLFIDINSQGVPVKRFDIIRTMKEKKPLLADTFKLIAIRQKRRGDYFYKLIKSDFAKVLRNLQIVKGQTGGQEKVDKAWERLLELVLFVRTGQHRTLAQILKAFIGSKVDSDGISAVERKQLGALFKALLSIMSSPSMKASRLATDQPHFYTLATSIHALGLVEKYGLPKLKQKVTAFAKIVEGKRKPPQGTSKAYREYIDMASQKTTHPGRRDARQAAFAKILEAI
jgi:Protein of unknown function DUF262